MKLSKTGLMVGLTLAFAGCGKSTPVVSTTASTISCTYTGTNSCLDYVGSAYAAAVSTLQTTCAAVPGTFSSTASCSTTSRIGSCDNNAGTVTETITRYYTGFSGGASAAQTACTASSGTWTAN